MKNFPSSRIDDISYHIRIFQLCDEAIAPGSTSLHLVNRLTQLDIPRQSWNQLEIESPFGVRLQKQLVRTNCADLVALSWHGYGGLNNTNLAYFDVEDFVGFKSLTFLRLEHWFGGEGLLARVLDGVAGTLEVLQLHCISDILPGAFTIDDEVDNVTTLFNCLSTSGEFNPRRQLSRRLVLPNLVTLKFVVVSERNAGLVELVSCCPHLERLCFTPSNAQDVAQVARSITADNLRFLRSITVKNIKPVDGMYWRVSGAVDSFQFPVLLRNSMLAKRSYTTDTPTTTAETPSASTTTATTIADGVRAGTTRQGIAVVAAERAAQRAAERARAGEGEGLVEINLQLETFKDQERLISAILIHSNSLRSLKLSSRSQGEAISETFLLQVFHMLPRLEVLSIKVHRIAFDLFKVLGSSSSSLSGRWACCNLRKLSFTTINMPFVDLENEPDEIDQENGEAVVVAKGPKSWLKSWKSWTKSMDKIMASRERIGAISSTTSAMGWFRHTPSTIFSGLHIPSDENKFLRAAFKMVNKQKLENLEVLVWNEIVYERSSVPAAPKAKIFPGDYCR
ncbi:MAG: hypothetical protein J3R72DRAFT_435392 [Linnemannia gamsii]|nr:MAG: hypothetical protein J3R72DRAFT_435392 [Linnemannia gamsii]